jgi:hypothetical protein
MRIKTIDSKGYEKKASQNYQTDTVGKVPRDYEKVFKPEESQSHKSEYKIAKSNLTICFG